MNELQKTAPKVEEGTPANRTVRVSDGQPPVEAPIESSSTVFRNGIETMKVPAAGDSRNQLFSYREGLNAGEGIATARPVTYNIDGQPLKGVQQTNGDGVTTFVSTRGSYTVKDGTLTPVKAADTPNGMPVSDLNTRFQPGGLRQDAHLQGPLTYNDKGIVSSPVPMTDGTFRKVVPGADGAQTFVPVVSPANPVGLPLDASARPAVVKATEVPVVAPVVPVNVPADVAGYVKPARSGEPVPEQPVALVKPDTTKAILDSTGGKSYDAKSGVITYPDGSQVQLPKVIAEQARAGQLPNFGGKPEDVRAYIEQTRVQQQQMRDVGKPGMDLAQTRDLMTAQRVQQMQADLQNPKVREQLLAAMQNLQAGKAALGPQEQRLQDVLKGMTPDRTAALKAMLENPNSAARFAQLDQLTQGNVANLLGVMRDGKGMPLSGGIADGGAPRNPMERLQDFLKLHERALDKGVTGESGKALFMNLQLLIKDANRSMGLEAGKGGLTMADVLGRRFEDGKLAGQLGLLPGQVPNRGLVDAETFGIKLNAGEQMTMRMMLLNQELAGKRLDGLVRSDLPLGAKPIDALLQGMRNLDSLGLKDAAGLAMNQMVRELGVRDANAVAANIARDFMVSQMKMEPVRVDLKPGEVRVDGKVDANTARMQADALAAAVAGLGGKVDPAVLQGIKDGTISAPNAIDAMMPGSAAAQMRLEEEARRKRKEKEEIEDEERREKEQDAKDAAFAALVAAKKRQELKEKEEKEKADEKDKKEPERRTKYVVKEGDTLESIASKMLRDRRLAALIYEINKDTIPVIVVKGKEVAALRPKMVIWLPTTTDIRGFRGRLVSGGAAALDFSHGSQALTAEEELAAKYGEKWSGDDGKQPVGESLEDLAADAVAAAKKRRENIENLLGPLKNTPEQQGARVNYVVRLGDSLKSVAMKHPGLQDVALWRLLAEVNDITTKTDEKGQPQASLKRGTSIAIPNAEEIAAFRSRELSPGKRPGTYTGAGNEIKTKRCGGCGRATISGASICPGCFRSFDETAVMPPSPVQTSTTRPIVNATADSGAVTVPVPSSGGAPLHRQAPAPPVQPTDVTHVIAASAAPSASAATTVSSAPAEVVQLSEATRVSRSGTLETTGLKLRLEMRLTGSFWLPVVTYEIFEDVSLRHEYTSDGSRKTVRIDLPPQAAAELAQNDVTANWQAYCDKFASTAR